MNSLVPVWLSSSPDFMPIKRTDVPWLLSDSGPAAATPFLGCGAGCVVLTTVTLVLTNGLALKMPILMLAAQSLWLSGFHLSFQVQMDTYSCSSYQIKQCARD